MSDQEKMAAAAEHVNGFFDLWSWNKKFCETVVGAIDMIQSGIAMFKRIPFIDVDNEAIRMLEAWIQMAEDYLRKKAEELEAKK